MYTLRHYFKNFEIFIIFILLKECPIEIKTPILFFKHSNIRGVSQLTP